MADVMPSVSSFGSYICSLRSHKKMGQRELARALGVSAPYLNDIEKNNRAATRDELIDKICEILDANYETLSDLAGKCKNSIPPDVLSFIYDKLEIYSLLRLIKSFEISELGIRELKKSMTSSNVSAMIIAAGLGSRLMGYTEDLPKCMLNFGGKTLLQRQLDAYNECGIKNISVIRGYKKEKINYEGLRYYENTDFENNNILNSLFYGEEALNGNIIISYSDILFDTSVVKRLLESDKDIAIVVDIDWREYFVGRKGHPIEEAENVVFNANNEVVQIGKILTGRDDVFGEFIGMMKFTPRGAEIFKKHFHRAKDQYWDKPFQRAKTFQKAYITDMIQEMVELGSTVHCVIIERGWKEIDTEEDYENALVEFND